jgi:ribonuclease BN (tRNA processing enzyme)
VRTLLGKPFFGTGLETFPFGITFIEVNEGSGLLGDAKVTSKALVHSDLVYGYRIEADGKSVCYCTDTAPCAQVRELARDADVLIHEAYFDEDDAQATGALEVHSSPTAAASAALNAHAKRLYLFHFHPEYDEKRRRAMEAAGRAVFKETRASYDWLTLAL